MTLNDFIKLFTEDCQYVRLYDLAEDDEVIFEGQIKDILPQYKMRKIILFETMLAEDFDGYFGIYIATQNEDKYYESYNN
jgi:hypothetical protein